MHRCANCGTTQFGMVRHYKYRLFKAPLHFCSRFCQGEYEREQAIKKRQEARARFPAMAGRRPLTLDTTIPNGIARGMDYLVPRRCLRFSESG